MTRLLDEAVAKVRGLSDEEQDHVAAMLLDFAEHRKADDCQLTPEQLAVVELARQHIKDGHFVSDEEMRERWRQLGL
jgi:hypothetical protein